MARSPENELKYKREYIKNYIGRVYHHLTVCSLVESVGGTKVKCCCVCGNEKEILLTSLKTGNTKSCGCSGVLNKVDTYYTKKGQYPYKFLGYDKVRNKEKGWLESRARVRFINTGHVKLYRPSYAANGNILDEYQPIVAGKGFMGKGVYTSKTKVQGQKIYASWGSMINRCFNTSDLRFRLYGERGITVCKEWLNFQNFASWYEEIRNQLPEGVEYQLDKDLKAGKNYSPENCILIPKSLNVSLQMTRPNSNIDMGGVGIRYIKETGKYVAQVTRANRDITHKPQRVTGKHRATLEEAKKDYGYFKHNEVLHIADMLYREGKIDSEILNLIESLDVELMLNNY